MAQRPSRTSRRSGRPGWRTLGILGLIGFLLLDGALVYFALTNGSPDGPAGADSVPTSTPPPSAAPPSSAPVDEPEPQSAPEVEPEFEVPVLARLLTPASATVAWRTITGGCESRVVVQRTQDAGQTWEEYPIEAEGARSVLALSALDDLSVRAVAGVGEDCEPEPLESFSQGQFWQAAPSAAAFWHVAPLDPGVVVAPGGAATTPCEEIAALAGASEAAAAVGCTDGSLYVTVDSGGTWENAGAGDGVVAVAATNAGYTVARARVEGCDGLQIEALDGEDVDVLSCVSADDSRPVALASADDALWLWVRGEMLVSTDAGATWGA